MKTGSVTGNDIVKALTESGMLDKEVDRVEGDLDTLVLVFQNDSKYIDKESLSRISDTRLIIKGNQWRLEQITWAY